MTVTFFGHACLKIALPGGRAVLTDPWFSPRGAFFSSWFQFPENTPLLETALDGVTDVCVSHHHADHLDPFTLRHACARNDALIIHVPRFATRWFSRRIARLLPELRGRFVEHAAYEPFRVGDDATVFFVPEHAPGMIDSAIVCTAGGRAVVNLNDSRLNSDQLGRIREMVGEVDVLALQGSGASEYPINYTYPGSELRERSLEKRQTKLDHCKTIIDLLTPRRILFFAGPPVFLHEDLARFNVDTETIVFPDQLDIVRTMERERPDIAARTVFVLPGDALDDGHLWPAIDPGSPRLAPFVDKRAYITAYAAKRREECGFDWGEPPPDARIIGHLRRLVLVSPSTSAAIQGDVTFIVKGRTREAVFSVDFGARTVRGGPATDPLYVLTVPASVITAILDNEATWDDAFLSFRMVFDERTSRFVPGLKTVLRYPDSDVLREVLRYEAGLTSETTDVAMMDVVWSGCTFRVQRDCPHAGSDLEHNGRVGDDGTITCLAHRFRFDLRTGECRNATGYRLRVEPPPTH